MNEHEAVETWWFDAAEVTRERALRLEPAGLLPEDMALDLILAGVSVAKVDTGDGIRHVIPEAVHDFLAEVRELRRG